jgi:SAM-dependent methyltransferase
MKQTIIDLGMHPYADTFISEDQLGMSEPVYPLQCQLDTESGLVSLVHETDSDDRYNLYDYSYTSANSKVSREHWNSFADSVSSNIFGKNFGSVLEIGSNDGYLTKQFQNKGHEVLGVDPSKKMCEIANEKNIDTICSLFSYDVIPSGKKFDLVIANNVFNHANDPLDFATGVEKVLAENGTFVFEVPYWYNTIKDKRFDQIYHEHVSYFTVKSAKKLLKKAGLVVYDVEWVDYHGGSIRVFASRMPSISTTPNSFIDLEEKEGLFSKERYVRFMDDIKTARADFLQQIYAKKKLGSPVVAVGAAAKGNTFLNFYNLDSTVLDYVTDMSEHKIGKYTPLTRIPILEDKVVFDKYDNVYVIILSWNISELLKEKLKKISKAKITFLDMQEKVK